MFDQQSDVNPAVATALDHLDAALNILAGLDLTALPDAALVGVLREVETRQRRQVVVDHRVLSEIDQRGVAGLAGYASTATLVSLLLHVDPAEATSRVRAAGQLGPRVALTGEALAPVFPFVAATLAEGGISARHARVITDTLTTLTTLPLGVPVEDRESAEKILTDTARDLHPADLRRVAQRLTDTLDPDGQLADDAHHQRRRELHLTTCTDGLVKLSGYLTPVAGAKLRTLLDSFSPPRPVADGTPDPRTAAERRHDGLEQAADVLLRSGELPQTGGIPTTLILTMTLQDAVTGRGYARTAHGDLIATPAGLTLVDEANLHTVVLNATGGIISHGRTHRLATPGQRIALVARDKGCSIPGCTAPALWCEAHHLTEWRHGGTTDINDLALVCRYHHRHIEDWTCHMINGRPHWTGPRLLDPEQIPRLNHAHDPVQRA